MRGLVYRNVRKVAIGVLLGAVAGGAIEAPAYAASPSAPTTVMVMKSTTTATTSGCALFRVICWR